MAVPIHAESGCVDADWLSKQMGRAVKSGKMCKLDKQGGMSGDMQAIEVTFEDGQVLKLAMKSLGSSMLDTSIKLGLPREAFFYNDLSNRISDIVPTAYYAHGDMATGEKVLLMGCLEEVVPAGVFFGKGNPNNWALDIDRLISDAGELSAEEVAKNCFLAFAQLHATFWKDAALLEKSWLRASDWYRGEGQASFEAAQSMARDAWQELRAARADGTSKLSWSRRGYEQDLVV
eukprot:TRINITY_DN18667_c0_g1_i3.p2 TRINITY_DN18667_c0_g1~~TRINITY_DN18667_c0_g1_i3.p2  ORF type:complete len:233 (+),score=39.91 TRINITY_DN18667_c0_g1_i3:319-1017(+)